MTVDFHPKLRFLFNPHRYKVVYGGRGGTKSWGFARALLIQAAAKPLRILCARETQKSIASSVHKLLSEQIVAMGLADHYDVQKAAIFGRNGSEFLFEGIRQNITNVKSFEGVDICWVEEAATVSKSSWDVLIPTIRKPASEIWISFNPELETDETYQRFVLNPPPGAAVVKVGWQDNPWFPDVLRAEMEHLREKSEDEYLHVWEGHCRRMLEGAIYANELREMEAGGRVCRVAYDPSKPVNTYWDLGWSDSTCIWFAQTMALEHRVIDYLEDSQRPLHYYLERLQAKGYVYGTHWLPHDARAKQMGTGKSIQELMRERGLKVEIVPEIGLVNGINAARTVFPMCWFDQEKCSEGLQALRHYRYEQDVDKQTLRREPLHDWASHGADAWRYFAVAAKEPARQFEEAVARSMPRYGAQSWMA